MKPLRWWAPVAAALVALVAGIVPYSLLSFVGALPLWLRDHPWPLELSAAVASALAIALAVRAFRQRELRVVATAAAAIATLATVGFLLFLHVATRQLPPAPTELAVGTAAPDFALPDETGQTVALSSLRGHPTLLVFYRGFW